MSLNQDVTPPLGPRLYSMSDNCFSLDINAEDSSSSLNPTARTGALLSSAPYTPSKERLSL